MASSENIDFAQDAVRCDLCIDIKSAVGLHCNTCQTNMCGDCVSKHIASRASQRHDIVMFTSRGINPKMPICTSHPKQKCDLHCNVCDVPVCSKCVASIHKMHDVIEILTIFDHKKKLLEQESAEIINNFAPKFDKILSELENRMSKIPEDMYKIKTSIYKQGEILHSKINFAVNTYTTRLDEMEEEIVFHLKDQLSKIKKILNLIGEQVNSIKRVLEENDAEEVIKYESKRDLLRIVPPLIDFIPPTFLSGKIEEDQILAQFGKLNAYQRSVTPGYQMSFPNSSVAKPSKDSLDDRNVIFSFNSKYKCLKHIKCISPEEAIICGDERTITRINSKGSVLEVVNISSVPQDISYSSNDKIIFCTLTEKAIYGIKDDELSLIVKFHGKNMLKKISWKPVGVFCARAGELIACLRTEDDKRSKLVVYQGSEVKRKIQYDEQGNAIFEYAHYVHENSSQDICVLDTKSRPVLVVVDNHGSLKFRYTGNASTVAQHTPFFSVSTDSKCQILLSQDLTIHVLKNDGQFICHLNLHSINILNPFIFDLDSDDKIWIGEKDTGKVKVVKYLL